MQKIPSQFCPENNKNVENETKRKYFNEIIKFYSIELKYNKKIRDYSTKYIKNLK